MSRMQTMDHQQIEAQDVIERYLQGRLDAETEARFEVHLLDCESCFESVQWGENFGQALREAAAEDTVRAVAVTGFSAWMRARRHWVPLALALILAAGVPSALLFQKQAHPRTGPRGNTAIYTLGVMRDQASSYPLSLPDVPDWLVLRLALPRVEHDTYRVTILRDGHVEWRLDDLIPDASDTLVLTVHSSDFHPGSAVLRVAGVDHQDSSVFTDVADFALDIRGP